MPSGPAAHLARPGRPSEGGGRTLCQPVSESITADIASAWSSLEVVKILVATLTPVLVVAVGFWVNRRLKALEAAQWAQQKVVERRIKAYDELAPSLNELYCYFSFIGIWSERTPPEIVKLKRQLDQTAHISAPLFDEEFLALYNALIDTCFETFAGWGQDPLLRTYSGRRQVAMGVDWQAEWDRGFSSAEAASPPSQVKLRYADLMAYLARAMGAIQADAHMLGAGHLPRGYDAISATTSRTAEDAEAAKRIGPD